MMEAHDITAALVAQAGGVIEGEKPYDPTTLMRALKPPEPYNPAKAPKKVDGDTPEERMANQQRRQIFRRYGIEEQLVAQLRRDDFEMRFIDRADLAVGILELEDRRSGWCVSWMPMMTLDGDTRKGFQEALGTIREGREQWITLWADVPTPDVWWIV